MGLRLIMLKRRLQVPRSKGIILRRTYAEVEKNHIRPLLEQYPELVKYYKEGKKLLTLPNGSTLEFGVCDKAKDLKKHQGQEYHDLAIEEAGEWPESWFWTLRGSNRSGVPGIEPRTLLTANPGGIGHAWLKRLFVTRRYRGEEVPEHFAFVRALVTDNPALMAADPEYVKNLDAEPNEMLRRAYRWGDWDIAAGQFFAELNRDVHYIEGDFEIPKHWTRFHSYDHGFNHPAVYLWWAADEDGNLYVYREFYEAHRHVDEIVDHVMSKKEFSPITWAGTDVFARRGQKGPTIAEEFAQRSHNRILMKAANTDRKQGAERLRRLLRYKELPDGKREGPQLYFVNCPLTFECVSRMVHDPGDVEDVLKVDSTDGDTMEGDDGYDCTRYGAMSRVPRATRPVKASPLDRYRQASAGLGSWKTR